MQILCICRIQQDETTKSYSGHVRVKKNPDLNEFYSHVTFHRKQVSDRHVSRPKKIAERMELLNISLK